MDVHHPDMQIITPAIVAEINLHDMETLLDDMARDLERQSSLDAYKANRDQLYRVASKAARLVIKLNAREWMR
jgi:hypothetical protein